MKFNSLVLIACIMALMAIGGTASAVCDDTDNNNTEATATPVGHFDMVSGVVCPDDPYDYYVMEIPDGSTFSGQVTFSSPQESTVIRIYHSITGARIVDDVFTNELTKQFVFTVNPGDIPSGTYYIRLFFWSIAAYEHNYTLDVDLEDGSSLPLIKRDPDFANVMLNPCPWPNPSGTARNANRANFQGPFGLVKRSHSVKMSALYTDFLEPMKYEGLVVGPDSEIVFVDNSTDDFYRYKFPGRVYGPNFSSASSRPPCFDNMGRLCVIEWGHNIGASLVYYNKFGGDKAWSAGLPVGTDYAVAAAGQQIYTKVGGTQFSVQVWDKVGNKVCDLSFNSPVGGVAEDLANKKFFVVTRKALHKFDFNGNQEWAYEGLTVMSSDSPEPWEALGPIVDYDGNVWATATFGGSWAVLKPDGTLYKSGEIEYFLQPMPAEVSLTTVALGSDGRFYKVLTSYYGDVIMCYEDWDEKVWSVDLYIERIHDMILDSVNRIYVCFSNSSPGETPGYGWKCLDPVDGHTIVSVMDIGEPEELAGSKLGAELAIGSDRQLIMLMNGGYLAVFETPTMQKGYIEMGEDKKEKFESIR